MFCSTIDNLLKSSNLIEPSLLYSLYNINLSSTLSTPSINL